MKTKFNVSDIVTYNKNIDYSWQSHDYRIFKGCNVGVPKSNKTFKVIEIHTLNNIIWYKINIQSNYIREDSLEIVMPIKIKEWRGLI